MTRMESKHEIGVKTSCPGARRLKTAAPALRFMANEAFPFNTTTSEERGGQRCMLGAVNKWGCMETCASSQSPLDL